MAPRGKGSYGNGSSPDGIGIRGPAELRTRSGAPACSGPVPPPGRVAPKRGPGRSPEKKHSLLKKASSDLFKRMIVLSLAEDTVP